MKQQHDDDDDNNKEIAGELLKIMREPDYHNAR